MGRIVVPPSDVKLMSCYFQCASYFRVIADNNLTHKDASGTLLKDCAGLDTNGCPLGNSKFTLLSDNLNMCLWLSACQVQKIYQNKIQIDTNVYNPTNDLEVIAVLHQFKQNCFGSCFKTKIFCSRALLAPA